MPPTRRGVGGFVIFHVFVLKFVVDIFQVILCLKTFTAPREPREPQIISRGDPRARVHPGLGS